MSVIQHLLTRDFDCVSSIVAIASIFFVTPSFALMNQNRLLAVLPVILALTACTASVTNTDDLNDSDMEGMMFDSSSSFDPTAPYLEPYSSSADTVELNVRSSSAAGTGTPADIAE